MQYITPWNVTVYSGYAHWHKEVYELCDAFQTLEQAVEYAKKISKYHPTYDVQITREDMA